MTEDDLNGERIKSVIELARDKERERRKMREGEEPGESSCSDESCRCSQYWEGCH